MDWSAVDYCDVFIRLSFWRHPFTAEHPLLRHWCRDTFLQTWRRNKLILISDDPDGEHISWTIPSKIQTKTLSCLYKARPAVLARLVWRQRVDLGRRIAGWACSECAAPSAEALCMRRAAASDTEALQHCAQTPAPDRCMHYLPDSSDTPRPAGGGKEKHSWERSAREQIWCWSSASLQL